MGPINPASPLRQDQIHAIIEIKIYADDVPKYRYVTLHDTPQSPVLLGILQLSFVCFCQFHNEVK